MRTHVATAEMDLGFFPRRRKDCSTLSRRSITEQFGDHTLDGFESASTVYGSRTGIPQRFCQNNRMTLPEETLASKRRASPNAVSVSVGSPLAEEFAFSLDAEKDRPLATDPKRQDS